ncbi:MAG: hypothetical protein ABFE13_05410 [Phycisphaerales bacterium]
MHSSTSSSDLVWPEGPWLKTWLLAIALAVAAVAGWETALRHRGHRPTIVDDEALWASQRDRIYTTDGQKAIVLIGDCRIQLGLVPQVLRDSFPGHRVVQLAIQETSPIATLRDLAADQRFDGIMICGLDARLLCRDMWDTQQHYVDYYHKAYHWNTRLNRFFATLAQKTLVSLHPRLRLDELAVLLARGEAFPSPYYLETHADRSRLADYDRVDLKAHRKWVFDRTRWLSNDRELPGVEEWLHDAMEVEEWVGTIQSRGGRVVFVQLPTSGQLHRYEETLFPKAMYWDAFAARTSALCIHFKDVPQLAGFDCPDTVHLDRTDAPRFTLELGKALANRDLLGTPMCTVASEHPAGGSTDYRTRPFK